MANEPQKPEGPNIVQSGINAGVTIGRADRKVIANPHPHGLPFVVLLEGDKEVVHFLNREEYPPRVNGTVIMHDADSFLEYWKRQHDEDVSYIYGTMDPLQFIAVLNEHFGMDAVLGEKGIEPDKRADWRDHRISYKLEHSKEWDHWLAQNRKDFKGNESFAYWLEDVLPDITAPDPRTMLDIALNIKVSQSQSFQKAVRLQDGNINLAYSNDVNADARTGAQALSIPESFKIAIPVFKGINAPMYEIEARFRFRLESGQLFLRYELVRPHKVLEQAFKDMLTKIQTEAGTTVLFGKPEAGN